jgi:hypothetical protein
MQTEQDIKNERFETNLAVGTEAEDYVYEWLKKNYSYVQDNRYQTREKGTGPRLQGKEKSVILPDFVIYDKFVGAHAIDVKLKTAAYKMGNSRYFTVDDHKFNDYMKCVQLMRLVGLIIIFKFENSLFLYTDKDERRKHYWDNTTFGKCSYLFEYDKKKIRR